MPSLTLANYQASVQLCGVPDLDTTTLTACLNAALNEIVSTRLWNFRQTDNTITNGSESVTDLGVIISATYDGDPGSYTIQPIDKRDLEDQGCDLTETGDYPLYFYTDTASTIKSYPLSTFTLRYYANPTEFTTASSTCILPDEMSSCLVYQAAGHAHARVGVLDMSQQYFQMAKTQVDAFDQLYNTDFLNPLPIRYPSDQP
jgi:hypothetical protein